MTVSPAYERARERLIVGLDVPTLREASEIVRELRPEVRYFKVGKQLFIAAGPDAVRAVHRRGGRTFLDLKLHDIPQTVAAAAVEAARLGVRIVNVHASGGRSMMRLAARELRRTCRAEGIERPLLIGVTVLTSMAGEDLAEVGVRRGPRSQVLALATLAEESGLDGVVCSPRETAWLKRRLGARFIAITPGIRPAGAKADDQKRIATPASAIADGSDYLVISRPILRARDRRDAARRVLDEIAAAL